MIINITAEPKIVATRWLAPKPRPIAIQKKRYISSSGSLMAVLNRITERAPTRPRDNAKDDLMMEIMMAYTHGLAVNLSNLSIISII